jgi:hypothetical protein
LQTSALPLGYAAEARMNEKGGKIKEVPSPKLSVAAIRHRKLRTENNNKPSSFRLFSESGAGDET